MSDSGPAESHSIDIGTVDRPASDTSPAAEGDAEPRRRLPVRRIAIGAVLAVGLAGAVAFGRTGWQIYTEKDATLSTPAQIGELRLDETASGRETAEYLSTALSADVDLDKAVGAVYHDAANKNVLFLGGTSLFWTPENDLETAFGLISDAEGAVTGLHDVDAGPLGGTMKCGSTKTDEGELTVCGWADHGSLAMAMFPSRTESEAAPLLREIRSTVQKR
ncbi:hypothetical protein [Paractinoplanes atraurantiacus]|uniref:Uncharacterized protein n=1 Tax=Paractinoplanes atraurantiacus TaxID=1036182 RepID=A0A285HIZ5_9ACTN|nr:hypothetical protein [Actinoplanes atraurantiacus]SNY35624.1 hypothetical protein SAMN05421748_104467 [Actinoplanes atraurantiacus]